MGKSKPNKWFKAVKKAFRSPSKERQPASPEHHEAKSDPDEKLLAKHDLSPASYQAPTPHPLPSYEIITHEEVNEPEHMSRGQPLPTPEDVAPVMMPANLPEPENAIKEEEPNTQVVEKHQEDDVESTVSEDDEAAAKIQQRFSEPMALQGLIRVQALVRGHRVRRQAATTLQTMEAIVRVQAVFRGRLVRVSKDGRAVRSRISKRRRLSSRAGAQYGDHVRRGPAFQESEHSALDEEEANRGKRPTAYLLTQQLKRSAPNRTALFIDCGPGQPHWGWAWLELWSNARPWEIRTLEAPKKGARKSTKETSSKDQSREYIEIIPGPRKNTSEFTTKEVDINTLKVKCYEDYVPTPAAMSRSSNPSSGVKAEKKDSPGVRSSTEKNSVRSSRDSPGVKSSTEKREAAIKSPRSGMPEKKEPVSVRSSSSPFSEKKEPFSVRSSPSPLSHDKKEPFSRSQKKEPTRSSTSKPELNVNVPPSSPRLSDQKKEFGVTSPLGLSEKKELGVNIPPSPDLCEKKEQGVIHPSSPEKKETGVIPPSSPGSTGVEQHASQPDSPSHNHRTMSRPPPIEVPAHSNVGEVIAVDPEAIRAPDHPNSPAPEKTSPAVSEEASIGASPSPQASETSLPVPETPPGAVDSPSVTMEHSGNGGERTESLKNGDSHSSGFSVNGDHLPGDDTPSVKDSASASDNVVNGHMRHQENGDSSKARKGDSSKVANGDNANNGESPGIVASKKPTPRYMLLTESAMTKQKESRSSSNPKTRAPDTPESPARTPKRYSTGVTPLVTTKGTEHSPKTAFGTRKSASFQIRGTPSPKAANPSPKAANPSPRTANPSPRTANPSPKTARPSPKAVAAPPEEIKPTREMETGTASPARRNSGGGGDGKRWRT